MTAVELRGVRKSFGAVEAVAGVDLSLPPGALTALVGPSGCGKTTLLRLIAGFETPDGGEVVVGDTVVASPRGLVAPERRRVGVVFQQLALFPHLDVAANVAYGLRGTRRTARTARVAELLDLVGLAGFGGRMPHELSGGQAQRVALARALAPEPAVVLLDEPFSSLDVGLRAGLRAEVRRILRAADVTTLMVTHDQGEALSMGDRVAVMFAGRIEQVGSAEEVYRRPASPVVAAFLGEANALAGHVRGGVLVTEVGAVETALPDGEAVAMVRPEGIELVEDDAAGAVVDDVDFFGHDQMVRVRLPSGLPLRVRLTAARQVQRGARVRAVVRGDVATFAP